MSVSLAHVEEKSKGGMKEKKKTKKRTGLNEWMNAYMESLAMERQSVAHNRDQLGMDLILMFMIVLRG